MGPFLQFVGVETVLIEDPHFLNGIFHDGNDADAGFESIAMYVRVMPRGTKGPANSGRISGSDMATPVSVPERQFSRGN